MIWILGEYSGQIENASELIATFLDSYADEPVPVQLQTLTAVVKLFLTRPDEAQALVQRVLQLATKTADSADLRDRAYIQWRLLSSDTEVAKVSLSPFWFFGYQSRCVRSRQTRVADQEICARLLA